jgi:hypothetical protein
MSTVTVNRFDFPLEHTIPPGAKRVTLKYCETCGFLFVSESDRNCRKCHENPIPLGRNVMIDILEELMEGEEPLPQ